VVGSAWHIPPTGLHLHSSRISRRIFFTTSRRKNAQLISYIESESLEGVKQKKEAWAEKRNLLSVQCHHNNSSRSSGNSSSNS
jgi:hypothetical protein